MSSAAARPPREHLAPRADDYLGPAPVREVEPLAVHVDLPDGRTVRAELAFALPYRPARGDVLLVIGKGDACYAIGVLSGSGHTSLALHGDVDLRAIDGRLVLAGDRGVEVRAPEVEVHAGKLRMLADAVSQTFQSVTQRVRDLLSVHAGQTHTLVDGAAFTQSKKAALLTEETVTINGKEVHLG